MNRTSGWRVVIAYGFVCAATQVLWLTYAAITTETARHYGVSVGAVGWRRRFSRCSMSSWRSPQASCSTAGFVPYWLAEDYWWPPVDSCV